MLPRLNLTGYIVWSHSLFTENEKLDFLKSGKPYTIIIKCSEVIVDRQGYEHVLTETYPVKLWPNTLEGLNTVINAYTVGTLVTMVGVLKMGAYTCKLTKTRRNNPYLEVTDYKLHVQLIEVDKAIKRGHSSINSALSIE